MPFKRSRHVPLPFFPGLKTRWKFCRKVLEDLTGLKVSSNYKFTADPFTHLCIRVHLSLSTIYKREKEGGVREREREGEGERGRRVTMGAGPLCRGNNNTLNLHSKRLFGGLKSRKTIGRIGSIHREYRGKNDSCVQTLIGSSFALEGWDKIGWQN